MNHSLLPYLFGEDLYHFTAPVVVVLAKSWKSYSEEEKALLQRILNSIRRLNMSGVRTVVRSSVELDSLRIFEPAHVLIFGSEVNEDIPSYQETPAQGFIVIRADDLNELDDEKKKNLWIGLQRMFGAKKP